MRTVRLDDGWLIDWQLTENLGDAHVFTKLDGWYGAPVRKKRTDLWQDGAHSDPVYRAGRELTLAGFHRFCDAPDKDAERDRLKRALSGAFRSGTTGPGVVQVTEGGVTLEAVGVQIDGAPKWVEQIGADRFGWELQLYADDPYLYEVLQPGAGQLTIFPAGQGSGLEFPLFDDEETGETTGFLEWSGEELSAGGSVTNLGNATAYPLVDVVGDFPSGFRLVFTGDKDRTNDPGEGRWEVTYLGSVFPASPVSVDMGGRVTIDGVDRSWALSEPFWGGVEPGGQCTFTIEPISTGTGTATLTLRPTYL